jgi:hypothetical protein
VLPKDVGEAVADPILIHLVAVGAKRGEGEAVVMRIFLVRRIVVKGQRQKFGKRRQIDKVASGDAGALEIVYGVDRAGFGRRGVASRQSEAEGEAIVATLSSRVSPPSPPEITSLPAPPLMVSCPSPPASVSAPEPPDIGSLPAPPVTFNVPPVTAEASRVRLSVSESWAALTVRTRQRRW